LKTVLEFDGWNKVRLDGDNQKRPPVKVVELGNAAAKAAARRLSR
jgi:hypothetical protein